MNTDDDLTRSLKARVDHLHEAPLTLDAVRGRARDIRRRRRIGAVVAAAAAVAVIAPAGLVLAGGSDRGAPPIAPTTTGPTGSRTVTAPATPEVVPIDLANSNVLRYEIGLPLWSRTAQELQTPTGHLVPTPMEFANAAAVGGDWVGGSFDNRGATIVRVASDGEVVETLRAPTNRVAVSPDGSQVAYVAQDPDTRAWQAHLVGSVERTWDIEGSPDTAAGIVGILPGGEVAFETDTGSVAIGRADGTVVPLEADLDSAGWTSSKGLISAQVDFDADTGEGCSAIIDTSGAEVARTCDYMLGQFSADGNKIIGYPEQDGGTYSSVSILDATTLRPLVTFEAPDKAQIDSGVTWRGDDLVAQVYADGQWSLMELFATPQEGPGGAFRTGGWGGPKPGDEGFPPYGFGAGPLEPVAP